MENGGDSKKERLPSRLELQQGSLGSMWPIRPRPIRDVTVNADPWSVRIVPGIPVLFLTCHKPRKRVGPEEQRRQAERILDLLSWEGGGHYELVPLDGSNEQMLWDWTGPRPRVQITAALEQKLPVSMRAQPAGDRNAQNYRSKYSQALRYYRCAQTASNPVAGFQNLYLAFEFLAGERMPIGEKESERDWLKRVLVGLVTQYPKSVLDSLRPEAKGKGFYKRVYEAARCTTFHAKPQKGPVAPFDEKEEEVRRAYELLMPHVMELLRVATGWPEGHRVVAEKEIARTGQVIPQLDGISFKLAREAKPNTEQPKTEVWDEGKFPRTYCVSLRVQPDLADAIIGMNWKLGPLLPEHKFQVFPAASVPMDLAVRLVLTTKFDGLVRSPTSPLDHIVPLRAQPRRNHAPESNPSLS